MDVLAEDISKGEYREDPEGLVIVKVYKRWYYGDPQDVGTFMQPYKGEVPQKK